MILVRTGRGLGDALMLSCVARELRKHAPALRVYTISAFSELFRHNPDITASCRLPRWFPTRLSRWLRLPGVRFVNYEHVEMPLRHHLLALSCQSVGLPVPAAPRPYVCLEPAELDGVHARFSLPERFLAVQSECGTAWSAGNKDWGVANWQAVVDVLKTDWSLVQVGRAADTPLAGVLDLRGRTGVREVAAILKLSRLYLGQEGGLHHLAAAVNTGSVIVLGGWLDPACISYSDCTCLTAPVDCAPCYRRQACDRDRTCMRAITPETVLSAVRARLAKAESGA